MAGLGGSQINTLFLAHPTPYNIDQGDVKIDQTISDRQRLAIRFSKRNPLNQSAQYFPQAIAAAQPGAITTQRALGGAFDYVFTLNPTYLIEFRWGLTRGVSGVDTSIDGFHPTQLGLPTYLRITADA